MKTDIENLMILGKQAGFTHIAPLDCSTIKLLPEVRQMCAENTCHMYGKNWSCPPGCGTLEECDTQIRKYSHGILVQTVGKLEDFMDGEGMMETEAAHKEHFSTMETYGMLVTQVCRDNGLAYYYSPCTISYTSCFLLTKKL